MPKADASILVVDDDPDIVTAARIVLRQHFQTVVTESKPERLQSLLRQNCFDVVLLDMNFKAGVTSGNEGLFWMRKILAANASQKIILITAYGDIQLAVEAMKEGAADFIVKPWENEKLVATITAAMRRGDRAAVKKQDQQNAAGVSLIGESMALKNALAAAAKVASTDANVLLLGENGTGKELFARYIHEHSARKNSNFVKVDLGALSQGVFESEMFGHKKGAFTDAREERAGRFEAANGGTLFLDEIANLPVAMQAKLLSVLQNREVVPLGSNTPVAVDIRLVAATNADIHKLVEQGMFREDLLYRINTVSITLPPLRERRDDIPVLAQHFLQHYGARYRREIPDISPDALEHLVQHAWPGNVRELQHAIERAVIMSDGQKLQRSDFLLAPARKPAEKNDNMTLDEMERKAIVFAIQKYKGNMSKVARELGLGRTTLYRKMTKYGLDR